MDSKSPFVAAADRILQDQLHLLLKKRPQKSSTLSLDLCDSPWPPWTGGARDFWGVGGGRTPTQDLHSRVPCILLHPSLHPITHIRPSTSSTPKQQDPSRTDKFINTLPTRHLLGPAAVRISPEAKIIQLGQTQTTCLRDLSSLGRNISI